MVTTPLTCLNYINGEWLSAQSQAIRESRNPADWGEVIATFPSFGAEDVDAAVKAANKTYYHWRLTPAPARAEFIYRVGDSHLKTR